VEASVADQGGGIGKVEWCLNGATVGVDVGAAAQPRVGNAITLSRTLALTADENTIRVIAYNAQGVIASNPARRGGHRDHS
jgi:hypothetical protein